VATSVTDLRCETSPGTRPRVPHPAWPPGTGSRPGAGSRAPVADPRREGIRRGSAASRAARACWHLAALAAGRAGRRPAHLPSWKLSMSTSVPAELKLLVPSTTICSVWLPARVTAAGEQRRLPHLRAAIAIGVDAGLCGSAAPAPITVIVCCPADGNVLT
jgi:hypothetical protein